ncbi:MAG: hypothetical protein LC790_00955, partial [Actinobacteria bacterium]|nr:hypothetical protein [Actinomycetota bacterium]
MTRSPLLLTVVMLTVAAPAASAQTTLDTMPRDTPVRTGAGATVWSHFDPAIGAFRLSVRRAGVISRPAIKPSVVAFDADVGPGPRGDPLVVYSRCESYDRNERPVGDCDLYLLDLANGVERTLTRANSAARELHPTIWHDQIAWVRDYAANRPVVYRRALSAPVSTHSTRVAGVPTRRCAHPRAAVRPPRASCPLTTDRMISQLELREQWLAQIVTYHGPDEPGFRSNEVRLVLLRTGQVRRVARTVTGLGGQTFLGLSFDARHLAWFKTCLAGGCDPRFARVGAFRYRVVTGHLQLAIDRAQLAGWAWTPGSTYHVENTLNPADCASPCPPADTSVMRSGEPNWKPLPTRDRGAVWGRLSNGGKTANKPSINASCARGCDRRD